MGRGGRRRGRRKAGVDDVGKKRKEAVLGAFVSVKQASRKRRSPRTRSRAQVRSTVTMASTARCRRWRYLSQ
jgi:hypothetical protein